MHHDPKTAAEILIQAADCIGDRAAQRDQPNGERSMARAVASFNALTGHRLTEVDGWEFMTVLKMARSRGGKHRLDDYVDGAAYLGLAGECAEDTWGAEVPEFATGATS